MELLARALNECPGLLLHGVAQISLRERIAEERRAASVVHAERKGEDGPEHEAHEEQLELATMVFPVLFEA